MNKLRHIFTGGVGGIGAAALTGSITTFCEECACVDGGHGINHQ